MAVIINPIGYVRAARSLLDQDDFWGGSTVLIELTDDFPAESLDGIEDFSHLEILFLFDRVPLDKIVSGARHPRDNPDWPKVGIFAQRGKSRPNRIGSTIVPLLRRDGRQLHLAELDALDGTPVLDIKPVLREFLPRSVVRQPAWASELMKDYWTK